ncbi:CPBP family intramembrane metalloprotease [Sporosarcina thermotolerans]|uniref:CPBP family intramembrane glutamic endopeptidase n=1 Tax=Sporosarcina thermotolerans TaxID=633404 RepID=UPI0024BCA2B0|nr:CPBP family intramembrane glutamic endopeptidase [Sporosarcina thermotolerans]WHT48483.1 CPBP family intramembrane metalloprotease [Sporosarcina thermotolerans]
MNNNRAVFFFIILTILLTFSSATLFYYFELDMLSPFLMLIPLITGLFIQKAVLKRPIFGHSGLGFRLGKKRFLIWAPLFSFLFMVIVYGISFVLNPSLFSIDQANTVIQDLVTYKVGSSLLMNILIAALLQLLLAPILNILIFIGEEVGWRGFLYPNLVSMYGKKGLIYGGIIWGVWHAPMIYFYDLNFGKNHHLGLVFMTIFCILAGIILQYVFEKSKSIYSVALMHGMLNISGTFIFYFSVTEEQIFH